MKHDVLRLTSRGLSRNRSFGTGGYRAWPPGCRSRQYAFPAVQILVQPRAAPAVQSLGSRCAAPGPVPCRGGQSGHGSHDTLLEYKRLPRMAR
jgi:hypothetical protein